MKIVAFSAWTNPEVHNVKDKSSAKRKAARIKNFEQKKCEILTNKEFRDKYPELSNNFVF